MKDIAIKCDAKGTGYWLALDDTDLTMVNGEANPKPKRNPGIYYLTWHMIGKPGDSIKITANAGGKSLGKIETKIPSGQDKEAGVMKLDVK
jgi:hypothetical protein